MITDLENILNLIFENWVKLVHPKIPDLKNYSHRLKLENVLEQLEKLQAKYGEDRYRPSPLLRKMVKDNKTFY